jgi:hypothetical protein
MTGMLQALPKTPLYDRIEREGRLVSESNGDAFVLSNIVPERMSRRALYEGYRWLAKQLYDFGNYRERTLDFLLHRGAQVNGGRNVRAGDLRRLAGVLRDTVLQGGPRRAWFTLTLLGATLLRRPAVFKEAVSFAIVHKAFYEYIRRLEDLLDRALRELDAAQPDPSPNA